MVSQYLGSVITPDLGSELWISDGSSDGTELLLDIAQGERSSDPSDFVVLGNQVLFTADTQLNGRELWITDGTAEGTQLVSDIVRGTGDSDPSDLTQVGNQVIFVANTNTNDGRELFVTDGTADGTTLLLDLRPDTSLSSFAGDFTVVGDLVFFTARDDENGIELWVTDATTSGTMPVSDINPGLAGSDPEDLTALGDLLLFRASTPETGRELWVSDGTEAGTQLLADIYPGSTGGDVSEITVLGDVAVFSATTPDAGAELWVTDGTASGTQLLQEIGDGGDSAAPRGFVVLDGLAYFGASESGASASQIWATDGTESGTQRITSIREDDGGGAPDDLTVVGSRLVFTAVDDGTGRELWSYDPSTGQTALLLEVIDGLESSNPRLFNVAGDRMLFVADAEGEDGSRIPQLLVTDGTAEGTLNLTSAIDGVLNTSAFNFTVLDDQVFFLVSGDTSFEVWISDGTVAGTQPADTAFGLEADQDITRAEFTGLEVDFSSEDDPDSDDNDDPDDDDSGDMGEDGPDTSDGDDDVINPLGGQSFALGEGVDIVRGSVEAFFGDVIDDFSLDDTLIFVGAEIGRDAIDITFGSAIIDVDTDGDGNSDGQFTLAGDFSGGDFMAVSDGGDTRVTFETFLPDLADTQAVDPDLVNGVINQEFLRGDGTTDFLVTLLDIGFAAHDNVVGVYEIDAAGNIVDTRILFDNANADTTASARIEDVEDGHDLGFFIVQDAADWASTLLPDSDTFSFINRSGAAPNISDGSDISLAVNGATVDEMVFHSFDETMNSDGVQHALSGVEAGGESIALGFEDLTGGGDRDYEDVVFRVEQVDDALIF